MLGELIGSINKERALVYLVAREAGYAREIARFFDVPLNPIQKALDGLERAGVLVSRVVGSTREYRLNPRYGMRDELRVLVEKALSLYPERLREELLITRTRPRRKGKPL
jgi:predicted transcriptional regulator